MHLHWHCYTWVGHVSALRDEPARRPTHPEFASSPVTPLLLADWFLKPRRLIRLTSGRVDDVLRWLLRTWAEHRDDFRDQPFVTLPERLHFAERDLICGNTTGTGIWLTGGRQVHMHAVACPNVHAIDNLCPNR
jgi:hypothetical protein